MKYEFTPKGVCAGKILFEVNNGIVSNVCFINGCSGNSQGVAALCEGLKVGEITEKLKDITCGHRSTSCPAQLAKALLEVEKAP